MFKILRRYQSHLLFVFLLLSASFLTSSGASSRLFGVFDSGFTVNAQATNVPNVPASGNPASVLITISPPPTGQVVPLNQECSERCDTNKDGIITKSDLVQYSGNPSEQTRLRFCIQQCPFNGNPPLTPSTTQPGTTTPAVPPTSNGIQGDCSGSTPGVPDGVVDLKDIEHFRRELNKESVVNGAPTLACDFDKNNAVDIIDFTNYIRVGYVAQTQQGNPSTSPSQTVTSVPAPTVPAAVATPVVATPAPVNDTAITPIAVPTP